MGYKTKVGKGCKNSSGENAHKKGMSAPSPSKGKAPKGKCP